LHISDKDKIAQLLAPPLDAARDFLAVSELIGRPATIGGAKLQS
jgi:hypothetical protein